MADADDEEEIYEEEGREASVEDDKISPEEEGFMQGYEESGEEEEEKEKEGEREEGEKRKIKKTKFALLLLYLGP